MNYNFEQLQTFVSAQYKNIAITFAILFVVVIAQLLVHEVVMVVNSIPVFNGLLQLIGLVTFINFCRANLITVEQRDALKSNIQTQIQSFL